MPDLPTPRADPADRTGQLGTADPRHTTTPGRPRRPNQQTRLLRTVVSTVVVLCLLSALIGYLVQDNGPDSAAPAAEAAARTGSVAATTPAAEPRANASSANGAPSAGSAVNAPPARPSRATVTVPERGNGKFTPVTVPQKTTARAGRVVTYSLEVEGGLHADPAATAKEVGSALLDARGWQEVDRVRFEQVTPTQRQKGKKPELAIRLVSPHQVDIQCAPLETHGRTSCATGGRAVLNYRLWMNGVTYFGDDLAGYRDYMVNHEVGHTLGHGHQTCPKPGAYAPIMLQQTLGLDGCKPWSWPQPPAASK